MKWIIADDLDGTGHMLTTADGWKTTPESIKSQMKVVKEFDAPDYETAKKVYNKRHGYTTRD